MEGFHFTEEQKKFLGSSYDVDPRFKSYFADKGDGFLKKMKAIQAGSSSVSLILGAKVDLGPPKPKPKKEKSIVQKAKEAFATGENVKFLMTPFSDFHAPPVPAKIGEQNKGVFPEVWPRINKMDEDLEYSIAENTMPKGTKWQDIADSHRKSSTASQSDKPLNILDCAQNELVDTQMRFQKKLVRQLKEWQTDDAAVSKCIHNLPDYPFKKHPYASAKARHLQEVADLPAIPRNVWRRTSVDGSAIRATLRGERPRIGSKSHIDAEMLKPENWTHLYGNQVGTTKGIYFKPIEQPNPFANAPTWCKTYAPNHKPLVCP